MLELYNPNAPNAYLITFKLKDEQKINEKFQAKLPDGLLVRIANPKGPIIMEPTPVLSKGERVITSSIWRSLNGNTLIWSTF